MFFSSKNFGDDEDSDVEFLELVGEDGKRLT